VISDRHVEHGSIHGDVYVDNGGCLALHGMVNGTLTVGPGGQADVHGMVQRLVVESRGTAVLHGMCTGDAYNRGGHLTIRGRVGGSLIEA
jgi:hypothetical protein